MNRLELMRPEPKDHGSECERVAENLAWALRCAAAGTAHRPAIWYAEDAAKRIGDPCVRARAHELCRAAREAGGYGEDPEYFPQCETAAAPGARAETKPRAKKSDSDTRHFDVADAAFDVAKLFATAPWRTSDGSPWPDSGWAMVRGCVITLAYEEWARAYGMSAPPVVEGLPEVAGVLEQARAIFRGLPLAALMPEYFGHVHEVLVGLHIQGGAVVPSGGRRRLGAHFTPEHLARRVVTRTVAPLLRVLVKDRGPRSLGERVLTLKICDPAVGAGAFPLSLVRLLAGVVRHSGPADTLDEAKRLIAVHVVHGVDKDRYGVLACKLALTLECRADRMPATWLDHAIHHGDALVGLSGEQIKAFYWKRDAPPIPEFGELYNRAIEQAARATIAHREQLAAHARYE